MVMTIARVIVRIFNVVMVRVMIISNKNSNFLFDYVVKL